MNRLRKAYVNRPHTGRSGTNPQRLDTRVSSANRVLPLPSPITDKVARRAPRGVHAAHPRRGARIAANIAKLPELLRKLWGTRNYQRPSLARRGAFGGERYVYFYEPLRSTIIVARGISAGRRRRKRCQKVSP